MAWTAFLDACVLYPWATCDLLLRLAERDVYRVLWSRAVLDELRRTLLDVARVTPDQAAHRIDCMERAFPDAMVEGHEDLVPAMRVSEGDRHVLAAAVVGRADVIVTDNIRHFPDAACDPYGVEVQSADVFLTHALSLYPRFAADVFLAQVAISGVETVASALAKMERRLPALATALRSEPSVATRIGG